MMNSLKKWLIRLFLISTVLAVLLIWFLRSDGEDSAKGCNNLTHTVRSYTYRIERCHVRFREPYGLLRLRIYSQKNELLVTRSYSVYSWGFHEQKIQLLDDRVVYVDAVHEDDGIPEMRKKEILLPPTWQDRLRTWLMWTILRW